MNAEPQLPRKPYKPLPKANSLVAAISALVFLPIVVYWGPHYLSRALYKISDTMIENHNPATAADLIKWSRFVGSRDDDEIRYKYARFFLQRRGVEEMKQSVEDMNFILSNKPSDATALTLRSDLNQQLKAFSKEGKRH